MSSLRPAPGDLLLVRCVISEKVWQGAWLCVIIMSLCVCVLCMFVCVYVWLCVCLCLCVSVLVCCQEVMKRVLTTLV